MSGAMTEFRITSDLSALRGQVIEANFDEVRAWLDANLAPYRNMAVSADDIPTAKTYRANIRKVKDRIEQSRKEAKNAALAAYSEFESKCKELTGLCDDAANNIDSQVKALEDAERNEKLDLLRAEYDELAEDEIKDYLPWGAINNPRWGNKTCSYESALEEIRNALLSTRTDLSTIRSMGGDDTPYLLDVYKQTRDLSAVVRKASELKTMRQREEERARDEAFRREEDARRKAELARMDAEQEAAVIEQAAKTAHAPVIEQKTADAPIYTVDFRVFATKDQLSALSEFMKKNGIRYGKIGE